MNPFEGQILDLNSFSYQEIRGQKSEWTPRHNPRQVSASANVNATDDVVRVDCTAGAVVITLETAVGCDGRQHTFKKIDASTNAMTVDGAGTETIDGSATLSTTTRYMTYVIKSNGTNWDLISSSVAGPGSFTTITATGLVDISAAGAGQIKFPATQNASADANTLDDYEEGTWTPVDSSGAALTFANVSAVYTKTGNMVIATCRQDYPVTVDGSNAKVGGLPFTTANLAGARAGLLSTTTVGAVARSFVTDQNATTGQFFTSAQVNVTNAQMSTAVNFLQATYQTA